MLEAPRLGWLPDPAEENHRDWSARDYLAASAPQDGLTLLDQMPAVQNQGSGGSCVLWALATGMYQAHRRQGHRVPELMGINRPWWLSRREAGLQDWNAGTYIRRACRIVRAKGFSRQTHDPYDAKAFADAPSSIADRFSTDQTKTNATRRGRKALEFRRLPARSRSRAQDVRLANAAGFAVIMGWQLPKRFKSDEVDWDKPFETLEGEPMGGGHAMTIYGYDERGNALVQNQWGKGAHKGGLLVMAPTMVNLGHDPWIIVSAPYFSDAT